MASTDFTDNSTVILSAWLDDVDVATYSSLSSVAGTNTITATGPVPMSAYASGQMFRFIPAVTNTGATTINVTPSGGSALGAKNVFAWGAACSGGELVAGTPALVVYDGTQFNIVNPQPAAGSFTGTLTGCTTAPTQTVNYTKIGNSVTVSLASADTTGTSNATTKTITGMPAAVRPTRTVIFYASMIDNGGAAAIGVVTVASSGVISFFQGAGAAAWTNSGTWTLTGGLTMTYTQA